MAVEEHYWGGLSREDRRLAKNLKEMVKDARVEFAPRAKIHLDLCATHDDYLQQTRRGVARISGIAEAVVVDAFGGTEFTGPALSLVNPHNTNSLRLLVELPDMAQFPAQHQRMVLRHELAHLKDAVQMGESFEYILVNQRSVKLIERGAVSFPHWLQQTTKEYRTNDILVRAGYTQQLSDAWRFIEDIHGHLGYPYGVQDPKSLNADEPCDIAHSLCAFTLRAGALAPIYRQGSDADRRWIEDETSRRADMVKARELPSPLDRVPEFANMLVKQNLSDPRNVQAHFFDWWDRNGAPAI